MGPILLLSVLHFSAAITPAAVAVVDEVFPRPEAVIPTNARLVAFGTTDADFLLTRGDQSVVSLEVTDTLASSNGQAMVLALPPLVAGEVVELEPSCADCQRTFTFAVGDADDVEAPTFAAGEASTFTTGNGVFNEDGFEVDACLPPLVADEPVLLEVVSEVLPATLLTTPGAFCGDDAGVGVYFSVPGGAGGEACFDIRAVDVAGNASAPYRLCLDLVDQDGCAQTTAMVPATLALLLLAVRRRRRATRRG